jgi:gliding motility-associated-like protein
MKHFFQIISLIVIFSFDTTYTYAKHIVGGDLSYECLGNNKYKIVMHVYRDCFSQGGADFDPEAAITVYEGNSLIAKANYLVPISEESKIQPNLSNPCLVPPANVCVEEAIYEQIITLPYSIRGYHISYQRCCRNETISNIYTPGDVGATYTIFITADAQTLCNNSPTFKQFPPIVICINEDINFDHGAFDSDGDSLVYEFCAPYTGATAAQPQPPQAPPPPYGVVSFRPPYTITTPLDGSPLVSIDPNTGLIYGVPKVIGQFVVGVCVKEYRDGQLLSVLKRDFQFNVTNCENRVVADIREDYRIGDDEFLLLSCGDSTVTIQNQSKILQFIDGYYWQFDIPNAPPLTSTATNPTFTFPGLGTYQGVLIVNPNSPNCSDTAIIHLKIVPPLVALFSFTQDTCSGAPITFTNQSTTGAGQFESILWNFGDGTSTTEFTPTHQFTEPGTYNVTLTVADTNKCTDTYVQTIYYYPISNIQINDNFQQGCQPLTVTIPNNSLPITGYDVLWNFDDGTTDTTISPTHTYTQVGIYNPTLTITSPTGCLASQTFPNLIEVLPSPIAAFTYSPDHPTSFNPIVTFTDQSTDAIKWLWNFDTGSSSSQQNPTYTFADTGTHIIKLLVTHPSGCTDSITHILDIEPRFTYFLPNAFTPNFDDLNDGFRGKGIFTYMSSFNMTIWNRWGEKVFETTDPNKAWNGQKNNTGAKLPIGSYVYLVKITDARNKQYEYKGFATIIK